MAEFIIHLATFIVLFGVILASVRFIKGPTAADRTVALDVLTIISTALIVLIALFVNRVIYLDVALVYAILSFIGVITVARFIEGGL